MVDQITQVQDLYQAYYTKSAPIVEFMIASLGIEDGDRILEPCGGDGVFVDAILETNSSVAIDVCELNQASFVALNDKYKFLQNVSVMHTDTLMDENLRFICDAGGVYTKIVANPPYGAWQDIEKRNKLKKIFPGYYVKESYALFLIRAIDLLIDGGTLVFIIPDTFLDIHRHSALRNKMLRQGKIKTIALFPSNFFPNVNFGYSNLAILVFKKSSVTTENLSNEMTVITNFSNVNELGNYKNSSVKIKYLLQKDVLSSDNHSFLLSDDDISDFINASKFCIGDLADCVTGIYSGNDKLFLRAVSHEIKFASKYPIIGDEFIKKGKLDSLEKLNGLTGGDCFVPIIKGGNVRYVKPNNWFLDWSQHAVEFYKSNKKARYQNASYYFRDGIGVPMVRSAAITASLISGRIFDQSIVGVFPKDESHLYLLLAFFNSKTCNKLINAINSSVNSSANYIKRIPFILPDKHVIGAINRLVDSIMINIVDAESNSIQAQQNELNLIFSNIYGF